MSAEDLKKSLSEYNNQLSLVDDALRTASDDNERKPLLELQSDLHQLIQLTQESLDSLPSTNIPKCNEDIISSEPNNEDNVHIDDEYALFMEEMAKSGAYEADSGQNHEPNSSQNEDSKGDSDQSDIEDELATLLGMKCAVYHTHKWGGQPTLHNAMVSAVEPRHTHDQFKDLQVRILYTHPTHTEMLPCPFYLDGECRFDDEKCRYSHGAVVCLSDLKEAIVPDFDSVKVGSRILLKLKAPEDENISLTKKSTEKYHLWHRAVVKNVDLDTRTCTAKLEQGVKTGEKRKTGSEEYHLPFEEIFPLNNDLESESDDSLSDTDYPENKSFRSDGDGDIRRELLIDKSLQYNTPAMGEWEKHTRGIGSKLMLSMGYVPGAGLGAQGAGRVEPVEARVLPVGKSLDHCMVISERAAASAQDPLKVEQKLKRIQKKEEERNKRAYEREKERERRNVFNFLNRTIGDKADQSHTVTGPTMDIKQSTSKDLNIEQFKVTEDTRRIEREIIKLNSSLSRYMAGSEGHRSITVQIMEKNKELNALLSKGKQISREQTQRKDKQKMTVF